MSETNQETTQDTQPQQDNPGQGNSQTADAAEGDTAATEQKFEGSDDPGVISDDQLPEDLQPTDDNPLAKPLDENDEDAGMSPDSDI